MVNWKGSFADYVALEEHLPSQHLSCNRCSMGVREHLPQRVAEGCTTQALLSAWHGAWYLISSQ